jgi:hypothetical protein
MALAPARVGLAPPPAPGNPESMALVGMPMYMWAAGPDESTWGPITRSASAGSVTVTATGAVSHSEWDMGDGTTVRCDDPGLAYEGYVGSVHGSACTHTYAQTSAEQPAQAYPVEVTTYWEVEWAGGGQDGVIEFTLTNSTSLRVGEVQVIRTA